MIYVIWLYHPRLRWPEPQIALQGGRLPFAAAADDVLLREARSEDAQQHERHDVDGQPNEDLNAPKSDEKRRKTPLNDLQKPSKPSPSAP